MTHEMHMLIEKVLHLSPGHWAFPRTIRTGDEAELLDAVVADLTKRLRDTFWGLEGEIDARTEDLREASAKDRTILDTIEHGILLFDANGKVTGLNPAAAHLIGNKKSLILGQPADAALPLHSRHKELTKKQHPVLHSITTRQRFVSRPDARLSVLRRDGTLLPVLLVVSPIVERSRCHGGIAVFQDITEERQIDYMKSEFISLASHQLRTPLSALLWYIELLDSAKGAHMNAEQRSYIREMETAAKRMSNLVDALLQVSRLEGGGIRPVHSPFDLSAFLGEVADEARVIAKDAGVSVSLHVPVRAVKVRTDPTLLAIVLQNLMSNAVKYTHSGGHVAIILHKRNDYAEITVSDDGIGIPQKEQQHLFQKLFRAKNVHKVDATGSGLGLYISKMVMGTLKGGIHLKSRENKGTEVTIRLPIKKVR
jgi:PAS domain S-box-containing protein